MDHFWQTSGAIPSVLALRRLIFGHRVTRIIATAAQLGLADHLTDTPQSAAALAPRVRADARALARLLRALASLGVVVEGTDGGFTLTPLGACLRTDAPSGMRSFALLYMQRVNLHLFCGTLSDSFAREGGSDAADQADGDGTSATGTDLQNHR